MSKYNSRPLVLLLIVLLGGALLTFIMLRAPNVHTDKPIRTSAMGTATTNETSAGGSPTLQTTLREPTQGNNGEKRVANQLTTSTNAASKETSDSGNGNAASKKLNELTSEYLRDNVQEIYFYGLVLDQDNRPVENADVRFSKTYGGENAETKSDNLGRFSLSNVSGRYLTVDVSKTGYYGTKTSRQTFDYSPVAGDFHPDVSNPIIFRIRTNGVGVDLITSNNGASPNFVVKPPSDGSTTMVDLIKRSVGGSGQLQIEKITPHYDPKDYSKKEWALTLAIPDGGFIPQSDEFPFEAPSSGYVSVQTFHFRPEDSNWTDTLVRQYYVVFGNPPVYGRIKIESGVYRGITLEYAINPTGSRNLEPKQQQ